MLPISEVQHMEDTTRLGLKDKYLKNCEDLVLCSSFPHEPPSLCRPTVSEDHPLFLEGSISHSPLFPHSSAYCSSLSVRWHSINITSTSLDENLIWQIIIHQEHMKFYSITFRNSSACSFTKFMCFSFILLYISSLARAFSVIRNTNSI